MSVNGDVVLHLGKSVLSCILLSACSYWSRGVLDTLALNGLNGLNSVNTNGVTSAVQWASVVTLLTAAYYVQYQFWVKIWNRKRERRARNQYRQTSNPNASNNSNSNNSNSNNSNSNNSNTSNTLNTNQNHQMEDVDLDIQPEWSEEISVSNTVYYPELTMSSVWTYVYGWGLLLFVCIYCLAGMNVSSSCWWVVGMIALSFDELISKGVGKWFICLVGLSLCWSVFAVWSGSLVDDEGNLVGELFQTGSFPFLDIMMGVVFPVSTPFIFFSIRSPLRLISKDRDVHKLFEFALPFMTVLAVCCLVATSGACVGRVSKVTEMTECGGKFGSECGAKLGAKPERELIQSSQRNSSVMVETVAKFAGSYHNNLNGHGTTLSSNTVKYALIFISPLLAFWVLKVLIIAILTGHTTEFITAFLLVTSARYGMTHVMGFWPVFALSGAGSAFVMLLFNVRV